MKEKVMTANTEILQHIERRIFTIRGIQVMLDHDLAELYNVPVKRLNEQVRRNINRFPERFMFQLDAQEFADLKSQIASSTDSDNFCHLKSQFATSSWGGIRKTPKAFTEQGVAMLSAVLNSSTAVQVSILIMDAFVKLRQFIMTNEEVISRMDIIEKRQFKTDARVEALLKRLNSGEQAIQGVFYDGQLWDAWFFIEKILKRAKQSIILIDNWATTETLNIMSKKNDGVSVTIITSNHYDKNGHPHTKISNIDEQKFNAQYPQLTIKYNERFHDRFLIIDDKELFLIGASLKDLGKKCFGFTMMTPDEIPGIKERIT